MLLTKKVKIKTHTKLKKYYENKGYNMNNVYVDIDIVDLTKNSHIKIKYKCDNCCDILETTFYNYNKRKHKFDTCKKCKNITLKKNLQEKYGVDNIFQLDSTKEKSKITLRKKYGVEHPMYSDKIKNKLKETNFKKYGSKFYTQPKEYKVKVKNTNQKKYGVDYYIQSDDFSKKYKKILKEKYGVEHPMHSDKIKYKLKQTNMGKYGVDNPRKNEKIKQKIVEKTRKTKLKNGTIKTDFDKKLYKDFSKLVRLKTNKNKKELFEKWDGYDYYDNEYIKNYFSLNCFNEKYPNIDHKISIKYGFDNKMSIKELSNIDNLCITKRINNLKKSSKISK